MQTRYSVNTYPHTCAGYNGTRCGRCSADFYMAFGECRRASPNVVYRMHAVHPPVPTKPSTRVMTRAYSAKVILSVAPSFNAPTPPNSLRAPAFCDSIERAFRKNVALARWTRQRCQYLPHHRRQGAPARPPGYSRSGSSSSFSPSPLSSKAAPR